MSAETPLGTRPAGGFSPRSRLVVGCVVAVGGGILALVALQADWHQTICRGTATSVPGGGSVRIGERISGYSGADVAGWLYPLAVLTAVLPALALMLDRRPRAAFLAVTALCALTLMFGVFASPGFTAVPTQELRLGEDPCREVDTAWRNIAFLGAVLALAGVGLAAKPATIVPKLGLPERPPSEMEP